MAKPFRIIVFISGRGSNLKNLLEHSDATYEIIAVLSNKREAPGLNYAKEHGIQQIIIERKAYESVAAQKQAILQTTCELNPELVVLAGFMQIISAEFAEKFAGKIINIHPSLLPAHPGLDTHQRVLAAGEKLHGCTVHFVDAGIDTGCIIAQASCAVLPDDTEESLATRVLTHEHQLYPWVVSGLAQGAIKFQEGKVWYSPETQKEASARGFLLNM